MTTTDTLHRSARYAAIMLSTCLATASFTGVSYAAQPSGQQTNQRSKQLAIFEQLLGETVQEYVNERLSATIQANGLVEPGTDEAAPVANAKLVVRVAMSAPPRGIYIDGYGVLFSIQTPQVNFIPQGFEVRMREPRELYFFSRDGGSGQARGSTGVIELRADLITRSLRELQALMERAHLDGAESEVTTSQLQEIDKLGQVLEDLGGAQADATPDEESREHGTEVVEPAPGGGSERPRWQVRGRDPRFEFFENVVAQRRALQGNLAHSAAVTTQAVNDAAVDTLARYGAVIKGLDGDERVSVLVFPPNRRRFGDRASASSDEEYVVSVRYRDIRDFDNEKIDRAEFRGRVHIHSRLGSEIELQEPKQRP